MRPPTSPINSDSELPATEQSIAECRWNACGARFNDLILLVNHLTDDHVGKKKNQYVCRWDGCPRKGVVQTSRFALISHLRGHTGERPFDCPVPECDKSFSRSDALAKHYKCQHVDQGPLPELQGTTTVLSSSLPSSSSTISFNNPSILDNVGASTRSKRAYASTNIRALLNHEVEDNAMMDTPRSAPLDAVYEEREYARIFNAVGGISVREKYALLKEKVSIAMEEQDNLEMEYQHLRKRIKTLRKQRKMLVRRLIQRLRS